MMYFKTWLKQFVKDMSPRGDLARDVRSDEEFPRERSIDMNMRRSVIRTYLEDAGACNGCLDAFDEAWKDYEIYTKE